MLLVVEAREHLNGNDARLRGDPVVASGSGTAGISARGDSGNVGAVPTEIGCR